MGINVKPYFAVRRSMARQVLPGMVSRVVDRRRWSLDQSSRSRTQSWFPGTHYLL